MRNPKMYRPKLENIRLLGFFRKGFTTVWTTDFDASAMSGDSYELTTGWTGKVTELTLGEIKHDSFGFFTIGTNESYEFRVLTLTFRHLP